MSIVANLNAYQTAKALRQNTATAQYGDDDPKSRVMQSLKANSPLLLHEVVSMTGLTAEAAADAVAALRDTGHVEVVKRTDTDQLYLSLTPAGRSAI